MAHRVAKQLVGGVVGFDLLQIRDCREVFGRWESQNLDFDETQGCDEMP